MLAKRKADTEGGNGALKYQRTMAQRPVVSSTTSDSRNKNCRVRVYVRVRPLKSTENSNSEVVQVMEEEPRTSLIFDPKVTVDQFYFKGEMQKMRDINKKVKKNQLFEFDQVFSNSSNNQQVFDATAKTIIGSILDGYNCSVFAYGATGAGKTYTMLGKEDSPGIAYLTIKELLRHIDANQEKLKTTMFASYIEVYNEEVRDLLSPGTRKLELREEAGGITCISGLKFVTITDADQLFTLLESGNRQRTQHPTDSNAESSRSHAVFQVGVKMQEKITSKMKAAKLTMIDLAGSERGCATGYKGKQFKEGRAINQSLLALGNCINALADGQKYVPYRDSKLTRILKDSLGGNCQTIMIANISPSQTSFDETYNTLKYATRARSIVTTANQNLMETNLSTTQYRQLVNDLKLKLSKTEAEMIEVSTWSGELELVMEERLKLYSDVMALESQKKITEWRISKALASQNLVQPDNHCERLSCSMDQWRKRVEVLKSRIDELGPKIKQNKIEGQLLEDRMRRSCTHVGEQTKKIYNWAYSSWESKVALALQEVENQHRGTMMKLMAKNEELLCVSRDDVVPFLLSCYDLLKAYGHVTASMKSQYEVVVKKLQRVKYVSWEGETEEQEVSLPSFIYYQQLSKPDSVEKSASNNSAVTAVQRTIVPAGGGLARLRHTTPQKNDRRFVSPLRTLQPTSKTIIRSAKSPKSKITQQLITSLNKENYIREPVKKQLYADSTKDLPKKRTPFKSSSLMNLRSAV